MLITKISIHYTTHSVSNLYHNRDAEQFVSDGRQQGVIDVSVLLTVNNNGPGPWGHKADSVMNIGSRVRRLGAVLMSHNTSFKFSRSLDDPRSELEFSDRSEIWLASRQCYCRV